MVQNPPPPPPPAGLAASPAAQFAETQPGEFGLDLDFGKPWKY